MDMSGDKNKTNAVHDFDNYVPNVAYTLGSHQPVRSTYIAHDPFFFMDVDDVTLEEELFRELEGETYTGEAYDENNFLEALIEFDENLNFLSGETLPQNNISEILEVLNSSRFASSLIEFANVNGIVFEPCSFIKYVEYSYAENVILYQPTLSDLELIKGAISALKKAWQNYQGALLQPVALYPDHAVFINRAQKADIAGTLLRVGWELDLAGYHELWNDFENGSMHDLAHSYGREAMMDFRSLNNGRAALAVFETWFLSDRSKSADSDLIQKMLSDYSGHHFEDEDMSQLVVIDLVKALGELPYGKNYLAWHIPSLLTDPIFTEVRERSAANFLWFIKFEKTFTEVEQSLQSPHVSSKSRSVSEDNNSINDLISGTTSHEQSFAETGILIPFPKTYKSGSETVARGEGAEVIPFDITVRPFNGNFLS